MVREDLYIKVPTFFRCPISLDVMKSPVSLSTGVTYDRSSIQRWLDNGNNTCPATMQVLDSKDFVPNHTLQRLIQIWSNSAQTQTQTQTQTRSEPNRSPPPLSQHQARDLIKEIDNNKTENCFQTISKLVCFAKESNENRKFLATTGGFLRMMVDLLGNADVARANSKTLEQVVIVLDMIVSEYKDRDELAKLMLKSECLCSMLLVLQQGSSDSRIGSARILESVAINAESKLLIAEHDGLLSELFRLLVGPDIDPTIVDPILSCLIAISMPRRVKVRIVRLGAVNLLGKLLLEPSCSTWITEKALKLLEMVSGCQEGRSEICEDSVCVSAIVQKVLKVSSRATEHAVTILWSVCYLFRDQKAQEAVTKSNGLTKILLLMQSNCSPAVRQMSSDLLKIFRVNSKSCLSSYDTKTTHIMPF